MAHPNSGAGWCEPLWYAPPTSRARRRHSAFLAPNAGVHVYRERNQAADSTPRSSRRARRPNQRFAGHGEMGDWGPVAPYAASGWREPSLAPRRYDSMQASMGARCTAHPLPKSSTTSPDKSRTLPALAKSLFPQTVFSILQIRPVFTAIEKSACETKSFDDHRTSP